jgi:hypothetical protein
MNTFKVLDLSDKESMRSVMFSLFIMSGFRLAIFFKQFELSVGQYHGNNFLASAVDLNSNGGGIKKSIFIPGHQSNPLYSKSH